MNTSIFRTKPPLNENDITEKLKCANCAKDRQRDLRGVCVNCYKLWQNGNIVKVLDTTDKDRWTCGCYMRPENFYPCSIHTEDNNPWETDKVHFK